MQKKLLKVLLIAFLLTIVSCATVEKPSGGPVDRTAPVLVAAWPPDSTVGFSGSRIVLEFNEFIKLNNPNSQLIMNPFPDEKPVLTVQGKKVRIELKDSLLEGVTYQLFFGNSIQDITEGNPASSQGYVFSTGSYLDSCSLSGFAGDAFTRESSKTAWVMLYRNREDFRDTVPQYIARCNESGKFSFRNISPGAYYLCALEDNNSNYRFDVPDEKIAFLDSQVIFSDKAYMLDSFFLPMFKEEPVSQKLLNANLTRYQTVRASFRKPLINPEVLFLTAGGQSQWMLNESRDTMTIWISGTAPDTVKCIINDGAFSDTLKQATKVKTRLKNTSADTLIRISLLQGGGLIPADQPIQFVFNVPIDRIDASKTFIIKGSDTLSAEWIPADSLRLVWTLSLASTAGDEISVLIKNGAVRDYFGFSNDSTRFKTRIAGPDDMGSVRIGLQNRPEGSLILMLSGKQYKKTIHVQQDSSFVTIINLLPGEYSMKFILDQNNDGRWTTGNFASGLQPERVYVLPRPVQVKKGWESKVMWDLGQ